MQVTGEFSYKLEGLINVSFNERLYNLSAARLTVLFAENDIIAAIKLVAEFSDASIKKLANYIPDLEGYKEGYYSYAFLMKDEILQSRQNDFAQALDLEDWLKAGDGLCLQLENYNFEGYAKI